MEIEEQLCRDNSSLRYFLPLVQFLDEFSRRRVDATQWKIGMERNGKLLLSDIGLVLGMFRRWTHVGMIERHLVAHSSIWQAIQHQSSIVECAGFGLDGFFNAPPISSCQGGICTDLNGCHCALEL